jgi:predicted nucleotidyltransferase component of viral defense system
MIPAMNIVAWGQHVPWVEQRQVEQDLIISRVLVELFNDTLLSEHLRFRGGTALNKLHFPKPLRYSEDIDLTRTSHGPIKPVMDAARTLLEPWMGQPKVEQTAAAVKLRFRITPEDQSSPQPIRLKIEINIVETRPHHRPQSLPFAVSNPWFSGQTNIATFSKEEILATKLRALLQRNKGRDLIDLAHAAAVFEPLDFARVANCLKRYLDDSGLTISRAQAEERMFAKFARPDFLADVRPLLAAEEAQNLDDQAMRAAFATVFTTFVRHLPGGAWARTGAIARQFAMADLLAQ